VAIAAPIAGIYVWRLMCERASEGVTWVKDGAAFVADKLQEGAVVVAGKVQEGAVHAYDAASEAASYGVRHARQFAADHPEAATTMSIAAVGVVASLLHEKPKTRDCPLA
jgi:hypothetical protein